MTSLININGQQLAPNPPQLDFILLDGSASMRGKWWPTLKALDRYVAGLGELRSRILLRIFSTTTSQLNIFEARNVVSSDWKPLLVEPVGSFWGGTPLYDAINEMGLSLLKLMPDRCSIIIATDGEENSSQTTLSQAKAILDWCRFQGWAITFLGCDFNSSQTARELGASDSESIGVQTRLLADAAASLAKKREVYGKTGAPMHWSESEQRQFGGYLSKSSTS